MNKLFLVCILLPLVAECISAFDLCAELKCGTAESKDACSRLNCALPKNIVAPAQNVTTATDQTASQSKNPAPSNIAWPSYPAENYPWDYPALPESPAFPFQVGYAPFGPFPDYQGGYQPEYLPFQYPFY